MVISTTLTPSAPTTPFEIDPVAVVLPRQLARMAGVLYLINIVLGAFAIGIVPAIVIVSDPAATFHALTAIDRRHPAHADTQQTTRRL